MLKSNSLRQHIQIVHGGLRKFSCSVCSKAFKLRTVLQRHLLIHDKPEQLKTQYPKNSKKDPKIP